MENQELTSVITVLYNTGGALDEQIASVLASDSPVELILINNGNPPELEEKLKALAASDPRVQLITGQGNIGFAKGFNQAVKLAKGKYLLFLGVDRVLPKSAIAHAVSVAAKLKPHYMIGARLVDAKGGEQPNSRRTLLSPVKALVQFFDLGAFFPEMRLSMHKEPLPKKISEVPAISRDFMFIPAESFWTLDGFDKNYLMYQEDLDFCMKFNRFGGKIYFIPSINIPQIEGGITGVELEFDEKSKAQGEMRYLHENFNHRYTQPVLWLMDALILSRAWIRIGYHRAMLHPEFKKVVLKYHK